VESTEEKEAPLRGQAKKEHNSLLLGSLQSESVQKKREDKLLRVKPQQEETRKKTSLRSPMTSSLRLDEKKR